MKEQSYKGKFMNNKDKQGIVIGLDLLQLIQQYILSVTATKDQPVAVATQILSMLQQTRPIPLEHLQKALQAVMAQTPLQEGEQPTFSKFSQ